MESLIGKCPPSAEELGKMEDLEENQLDLVKTEGHFVSDPKETKENSTMASLPEKHPPLEAGFEVKEETQLDAASKTEDFIADHGETNVAEEHPVESHLVNDLSSLISKRAPRKSRYITNKILHECKGRIQQLLENPDLLEEEISRGVEASMRKCTSRRRRGRRGGKKVQRKRRQQQEDQGTES